jgi:competence protein ComEC
VALSGYNVSIVADTIAKILGLFLPRIAGLFLGGLGIILFVLMTGASSTAIRAGAMALILIFSRITGRSTHVFRVMALAALAMIIANPMFLVSDVSFQLSFLATIGLLIVSPTYVSWLEKYLPKGLAEAVGTTLAAETAVAPFIMYKMGVFSTIALPVNVMILPFIPLLMLGGFIVICISFTMPLLGTIIGYPTYVLAGGLIGFIGFAARVPFASVHMPEIPAVVMLIFYTWLTWYFTDRTLTNS